MCLYVFNDRSSNNRVNANLSMKSADPQSKRTEVGLSHLQRMISSSQDTNWGVLKSSLSKA